MGFCEAPWIEREEEHVPGRRDNGFLSDLYIFVASGERGRRACRLCHYPLFGHFASVGTAAVRGGNSEGAQNTQNEQLKTL